MAVIIGNFLVNITKLTDDELVQLKVNRQMRIATAEAELQVYTAEQVRRAYSLSIQTGKSLF